MSAANARIQGNTLHVSGVLDRAAVIAVWPHITPLPDIVEQLDMYSVTHVDSAGLALLAELIAQLKSRGEVRIIGKPEGLRELSAAYRLTPDLEFKQ